MMPWVVHLTQDNSNENNKAPHYRLFAKVAATLYIPITKYQ